MFIKEGQNFACVVDFAHTPDAMQRIIDSVKGLGFNKIITVFGCGGNRDREKRLIMGEIGVNNSDYVIVTSDNPRDEDPNRITLDIELGIRRTEKRNYEVVLDREAAILKALHMARPRDIVLLLGKGHENYQIVKVKNYILVIQKQQERS
jgi:UDP-N-acetylmuramoyl-L-alanyl-D-glutamate--2,6-diaminopimelate ligase